MCLRELPTQDSTKGGGFLSTQQMRQDLLFLQTPTTWLEDKVIGMSMVEDGELLDGPEDPADWPYKTVLEAIRDGWRVVRFPVVPPSGGSMDSHVFCEFILEKLR